MALRALVVDIPEKLKSHFAHANVDSEDPADRNKLKCLKDSCKTVLQYNKGHGWYNFERHLVSVHKLPADVLGKGKIKKERKSLSAPRQKYASKSQRRKSRKVSSEVATELLSKENSSDSGPYGSDEEDTSGTMHHLRKMKKRFNETNQPIPPESFLSPEEKMEMLEKTLSTFRSEVDMKLRIIQQILTTRNEQVTVQKRLLDREQMLYTSLLSHWINAPSLAATGASINFSSENQENEYGMDYDYQVIEEDYEHVYRNSTTERVAKPKPSRNSQRKRRKTAKAKMDIDDEFMDSADSNTNDPVYVDPSNVLENMSDEGEGKQDEESWNASPGATVLVKTEDEGNDEHEFEHDSVDANPQKSSADIPVDARQRILKLLNRGISTPQAIHSHLIQFGFNTITVDQLNRYLRDAHPSRQRAGSKLGLFRAHGHLDSVNCPIAKPFTGEVIIDQSEFPIKSVELQLVRVETCGCAEGYAKDASEIQTIQIGEGNVIKGLPIPIFMVFPRLFSCPSVVTTNFKIEFEVNVVIIFANDFFKSENFPIQLTRF